MLLASRRAQSHKQLTPSSTGHYNLEHWDPNVRAYVADPNIQTYISVEETFDNDHRIVSQRSAAKGRFTFSAADSGEHRICLSPIGAQVTSGWLVGGQSAGSIRLTLDMAIGATSQIESNDKSKMQDLQQKVRDLNARLQDIRREQVFQRVSAVAVSRHEPVGHTFKREEAASEVLTSLLQEREAEFRDQSESTNAKVVRWTLIQVAVLGVTCAWQLSHLRAFFIKQKLT